VGYKLYGIDFEDCREGAVEEDIGRLNGLISITYEPAFTEYKMQFAREVLSALGSRMPLDSDQVLSEIVKELDAIGERRGMEIPGDIAERIMAEDLSEL
jgi:hypothetical protein